MSGERIFLIILILLFSHFAIANVTKSPDHLSINHLILNQMGEGRCNMSLGDVQ